jgi:hypothetical protein
VLYEVQDATDFAEWSLGPPWTQVGDMLVSDGSASSALLAPVDLGHVNDYAVEAEIQYIHGNYTCSEHRFGVFARSDGRSSGYAGLIANLCSLKGGNVSVFSRDQKRPPDLAGGVYEPRQEWHTYRLEVVGNEITLLVDGAVICQAIDNQFLTGGGAGLLNIGVQINVRSFRVVAL